MDPPEQESPEQLPCFTLRQAVVCEFGKTKWILNVQVKNDISFVCLEKWDRNFVHFAMGEALDFRADKKRSANKVFFDEMVQARKQASIEAIKKVLTETDEDQQVVDADAKQKKRKVHHTIATIAASEMLGPAYVDIHVRGHTMKVLCSVKSNAIWMELNEQNMEFVRSSMVNSEGTGRSWNIKRQGSSSSSDKTESVD
jgi:hypothetical protein